MSTEKLWLLVHDGLQLHGIGNMGRIIHVRFEATVPLRNSIAIEAQDG